MTSEHPYKIALNDVNAEVEKIPEFKKKFSALTNNTDRVKFCLAHESIREVISDFIEDYFDPVDKVDGKFADVAKKHRLAGNDLFRINKYRKSIQEYSKAIANAPELGTAAADDQVNVEDLEDASELPLAYGNRSAAYFRIEYYENALKDAEDAIELDYGRFKPVTKLQIRKVDCLIKLNRLIEAKEYLLAMKKPDDQNDGAQWEKLYAEVIENNENTIKKFVPMKDHEEFVDVLTRKDYFKPQDKLPALDAKLELRYDPKKGRYLVAKEDIQFGDIVAVTRPFVSYLLPRFELSYCHHCTRQLFEEGRGHSCGMDNKNCIICQRTNRFDPTVRPIPCPNCSQVLFCSEQCRALSWTAYHQFECGYHSFLYNFTDIMMLSLRMLYTAGLDRIQAADEKPKDSVDLSGPEDYSLLYELVHFSDGRLGGEKILPFSRMLERTVQACMLLKAAKFCGFIKPGEDAGDNIELLIFVGGILLRHILQDYYNSPSVMIYRAQPEKEQDVSSHFFPIFGLFNHACLGKAALSKFQETRDGTRLMQAVRPISAGEEVTISYGLNYDQFSYQARETLLRDHWHFRCYCERCELERRDLPPGITEYYPIGCVKCGHLVMKKSKSAYQCSSCDKKFTVQEIKQKYAKIKELWPKASHYDYEALMTLDSGGLFHRTSSHHLAYAYHQIGVMCFGEEQYDWITLLERSLTNMEGCFGSVSEQVMTRLEQVAGLHESGEYPIEGKEEARFVERFYQPWKKLHKLFHGYRLELNE